MTDQHRATAIVFLVCLGTLASAPIGSQYLLTAHLVEGNLPVCSDKLPPGPIPPHSLVGFGFAASIRPPWGEYQFLLNPASRATLAVNYDLSGSGGGESFPANLEDYAINHTLRVDVPDVLPMAKTGLKIWPASLVITPELLQVTYNVRANYGTQNETYEAILPLAGCSPEWFYLTVGSVLYTGPLPYGRAQYSVLNVLAKYLVERPVVKSYLLVLWFVVSVAILGSIVFTSKRSTGKDPAPLQSPLQGG